MATVRRGQTLHVQPAELYDGVAQEYRAWGISTRWGFLGWMKWVKR